MLKPNLLLFAGKPGVGKSTLIKTMFENTRVIDVLKFIRAHQIDGKIIEEKTILGYQDMYQYVASLPDELTIIEIGTNHAVFNIEELKKLESRYFVQIFLCDASVETAHKRLKLRLEPDIDIKEIQERLKRDFPNSFLEILKDTSLTYKILSMERSLEEIRDEVSQELNS